MKYYWILKYAKKREVFYAGDLELDMKADEIFFDRRTVQAAVDYWEEKGVFKNVGAGMYSNGRQVKKYVYVKDPDMEGGE